MPQKVPLNVLVSPHCRVLVKKKAAEQGVTMATLLEQIILEWEKDFLKYSK
jgi:hypothetical protein